jgi:hypothetical protein
MYICMCMYLNRIMIGWDLKLRFKINNDNKWNMHYPRQCDIQKIFFINVSKMQYRHS